MKICSLSLAGAILSAVVLPFELCAAPLSTAFTYQGRLTDSGAPPTGVYDFRFELYDATTSGTWLGQVLVPALGLTNGQFAAMLDFGSVFNGDARWLSVAVKTNGAGTYTTLWPRQQLTAAPYAQYAPRAGIAATATLATNVPDSSVNSSKIVDGSVAAAKLAMDGNSLLKVTAGKLSIESGNYLSFNDNAYLNTHDLYLQAASDHGLGWYGPGRLFAGTAVNGPALYGTAGGVLGWRSGGDHIALAWNNAGVTINGEARVPGLLRSGSESGTTEPPSPAGLVVRRLNSIDGTAGRIVAVARTADNTANITLERDGTSGGFRIRYPANPGPVTIAFMGMDSTGATRNFFTALNNPGTAGTVQVYTDALSVRHFQGNFGVTYYSGQHLTQVTLSRWGADPAWSGTLMSTCNQ